ncbi:MAG: DinB family protein [Candidatus Latescibacterota bacterium]|nr:DinB family protein [Candidatus Latescibacterota bacterium]
MTTPYDFLIDTFDTERLKTLSVWAQFTDADLRVRPHESDHRGRDLLEQMVHQCMSENLWFCKILGVDVGAPPLPDEETRAGFIERYATDSAVRVDRLREQSATWWQEAIAFFEVERARARVMTRRIAHSAHHRGQLTYLLRQVGRTLHSMYGPTADTGGSLPMRRRRSMPILTSTPYSRRLRRWWSLHHCPGGEAAWHGAPKHQHRSGLSS